MYVFDPYNSLWVEHQLSGILTEFSIWRRDTENGNTSVVVAYTDSPKSNHIQFTNYPHSIEHNIHSVIIDILACDVTGIANSEMFVEFTRQMTYASFEEDFDKLLLLS